MYIPDLAMGFLCIRLVVLLLVVGGLGLIYLSYINAIFSGTQAWALQSWKMSEFGTIVPYFNCMNEFSVSKIILPGRDDSETTQNSDGCPQQSGPGARDRNRKRTGIGQGQGQGQG